MNRAEKKELRTCTKQGLIDLINDPRYTQNKANQFPAIIGYLARHGLPGGTTKEDFFDLVYTARNELLAQAAKQHAESKNPLDYGKLGNLQGPAEARVKAFLRDPMEAIAREMNALYSRKENYEAIEDPDEVQYYVDLKTNANILTTIVNVSGPTEKGKYEDRPEMVDILARLSKKTPEQDVTLDASLKRINSGFFGTLFRRQSKEYKAFQNSLNEFRDAKWAHSGNVEDLEKKTTAYLKHVIPEFKYGKDMPREQWLQALPKGKRERAEFAMNVLDSIAENKQMKPYMDNVEKAVNGKKVVPVAEPKPIIENEEKQKQFQQSLEQTIVNDEPQKEEAVVEENPNEIKQSELEA